MNKSMMHTYGDNTPQAWDDIRNHEALFESFASMYLREHPGDMLRLKREHTYKVLAHARAIVAQEGLASQEEGRPCLRHSTMIQDDSPSMSGGARSAMPNLKIMAILASMS